MLWGLSDLPPEHLARVAVVVAERGPLAVGVADRGRLSFNRGSTIESAPSSLQLCIYCGSSIT